MDVSYSVLMSVYYKENPEWLRQSIESMLNQSVPPAEMVIVKDGKLTEKLDAVLEDYSAQNPDLFHIVSLSQNMGLGIALKKGVLACSNEVIARMDTDDYACPERMKLQLKAMEEQGADIVSSNIGEFSDTIEHITNYKNVPETQEEIYRYAKRRNPFNHPAVIFRKSKVLEAGNYRNCHRIEDYDLWVRMLQAGCNGYNVQEPLVYMRVNQGAYERRGGSSYLKSMLRFNWGLLKCHWCGIGDFMVRSVGNIVVALLPNSLRDWSYKKLLRK